MSNVSSIRIKNIYYMLSYAFRTLQEQGYRKLSTEEFANVAELGAAILEKGISLQVKRGLGQEYVVKVESMSAVRGKIDISDSVRQRTLLKKQLICTYDEFAVDTYMNRVIKATIEVLLKSNISKTRKKDLRKVLVYFSEVSSIDPHQIQWGMQYNRNNQTYKMLMFVCHLILKGLLQTNIEGTTKMMDFLDDQRMCQLYERFLLEYYKKEYPQIRANASQIKWALDDDYDMFLPVMQSDIMLSQGNKILIIDAKYYSKTMQTIVQYDSHTLHSQNLYQIFTYVKNKAAFGGEVAGLLLYARTNEDIQPNQIFQMDGNTISVKTLDLDNDFSTIVAELNRIPDDFFEL